MLQQRVCSSKRYRIKCIMQYMDIRQQNLLLSGPMLKKKIWD